MSTRIVKPTTPGQRGAVRPDFSDLTTKKPVKSLLKPLKRSSGRNHRGVITVRRRGGGAKRRYRLVSFKLPSGFSATVQEIEYDPNRSTRLARLRDANGRYYYVLATKNMVVGQTVEVGEKAPIKSGNRLPLKNIPTGSLIHNLELLPGKGGQMVRSAGLGAQLSSKDDRYAQVKLPSGEIRLFPLETQATLGVLGNEQHKNLKLGKAGSRRHRGRRPKIRGVATNAADHPHGGGEAKGKGYKTPVTPWGQPTLGYKTRKRHKNQKMIVRSRHSSKKRRRR